MKPIDFRQECYEKERRIGKKEIAAVKCLRFILPGKTPAGNANAIFSFSIRYISHSECFGILPRPIFPLEEDIIMGQKGR